ncbi:PREDICTED: geranylgeranyl pyrophosphate synthase atmG-like [Trachymyrmex cornetzi]|uniref:geranylgeranyl pyrophosphate synthase atmG-like n=1 Tax=Trachymyrmex cornetzi TaxID=471704 RepID=UPI00084F7141|nr:PREDICTED: geranylgeranyl pyrophosphate synthase atmG-like [Trachymyrmex cornetzi]
MTDSNKSIPFYYSTSGNKEEDEKLLEPIRYILQVPGKQIRAKLAKAFNYWLKISDDKVQEIDDIINMLHNSSILFWLLREILLKSSSNQKDALMEFVTSEFKSWLSIDDIQDNSIMRRGIPVAHSVYGIASSLSAANYVLFIALERVINLKHPAILRDLWSLWRTAEGRPLSGGDCVLTSDRFMVIGIRMVLLRCEKRDEAMLVASSEVA